MNSRSVTDFAHSGSGELQSSKYESFDRIYKIAKIQKTREIDRSISPENRHNMAGLSRRDRRVGSNVSTQ